VVVVEDGQEDEFEVGEAVRSEEAVQEGAAVDEQEVGGEDELEEGFAGWGDDDFVGVGLGWGGELGGQLDRLVLLRLLVLWLGDHDAAAHKTQPSNKAQNIISLHQIFSHFIPKIPHALHLHTARLIPRIHQHHKQIIPHNATHRKHHDQYRSHLPPILRKMRPQYRQQRYRTHRKRRPRYHRQK
jgi:hypothetical protein